jgi:hypothetical protein
MNITTGFDRVFGPSFLYMNSDGSLLDLLKDAEALAYVSSPSLSLLVPHRWSSVLTCDSVHALPSVRPSLTPISTTTSPTSFPASLPRSNVDLSRLTSPFPEELVLPRSFSPRTESTSRFVGRRLQPSNDSRQSAS